MCTAFSCRRPCLALKWAFMDWILYGSLAFCGMAGKAATGTSCLACYQKSRGGEMSVSSCRQQRWRI